MSSSIFFWNILVRIGLITGTAFLFVWFAHSARWEFIFILLTGTFLLILQVFLLTRYVVGISRIIEQFIEAVGREESPEILFGADNALYRKLKERSNAIKEAMNRRRMEKEKDERILYHVINSADQGLFCFNNSSGLVFANQAAQALVSRKPVRHLEDIIAENQKLGEAFRVLEPGEPRVLRLEAGTDKDEAFSGEQLLSLRMKEVRIFEEVYRLYSLQNIQAELHRKEADSWQKIIRVLTHEIMNAVAPMLSLSKSLQRRFSGSGSEADAKLAEGLRMIESTGQGLMDFTEEYRRLSLLPPPKRKRLSTKAVLEDLRLLIEPEAREQGIQLDIKSKEEGCEILADPLQLEMVLLNLWKNAVESFPEGQGSRQVIIGSRSMDKRVLIELEDNGSGIAPDLIDQVFVPFFSTKEKGSGIGLSLARQIMNNHQGSIHLSSEPGQRTVVTLIF